MDEAFFAVVKTPRKKPTIVTGSRTTTPGIQTPDISRHPNVLVPGPVIFNAVAPLTAGAPKYTISREWPGKDRTLTPETLPCLPLQTRPFNEGSTSGTIQWAEDVGTKQLGLKDRQLGEHMVIAYGSFSSIDSMAGVTDNSQVIC